MSQLRYRVTFTTFRNQEFSYCIATLFGEPKAVVMATEAHNLNKPKDTIFNVRVEPLTGHKPDKEDLVDRYEW